MKKQNKVVLSIATAILLSNNIYAKEAQENPIDNQVDKREISANLGTMIVTAQKEEENIQEVPVSVTALSDIQIEDAGIDSLEALGFYTPNLSASSSGNRTEPYIVMRGMYNRMSVNPMASLFVDGVAASRAMGFDIDLVDIERIEVLRGPQGTLFGRNTEAGAISIITKKPGNITEGKVSASFGNYNTQDYSFAASGPLIQDTLYFGISGRHYLTDGYFKNDTLGINVGDSDDTSGRATLRWTPNESWDIILRANVANYETNSVYAYEPLESFNRHLNLDYPGGLKNDSNGQSLSIDYDGKLFKFTSITAHRAGEYTNKYDMDSSINDLYRHNYTQDQSQWSQELRFASPEDSGAFKWLIGAYYLDEDFDVDSIKGFQQGFPSWGIPPYEETMITELETKNHAFFGQANYTFWEKLGLTAGLRYEVDNRDFRGLLSNTPDIMGTGTSIIEDDTSLKTWLPKFAIDYKLTQDVMFYISTAKGYTAGGYNNLAASVLGLPYDEEYSWSYEAGVKTNWLENRLLLNFSAFNIDWQDKQVFVRTGPTSGVYKNAAEATIRGFEIEAQAMPIPGLEITGNLGYTDAKYDKFSEAVFDPITGVQTGEIDYAGKRLETSPKFNYNLALQYRHPISDSGNLMSRIELQGTSDLYWDLDNSVKQESYELVNLKLGYEEDRYSIYLWGKNIFDKTYASSAWGDSSTGWFGRAGVPQTFGVTFTARF